MGPMFVFQSSKVIQNTNYNNYNNKKACIQFNIYS